MKRDNQVELTFSDWAASSLLVTKRWNLSLGCRPRGPKRTNRENMLEVFDSLQENMYLSTIDFFVGRYFQKALEEESQNLKTFVIPLGLYKWKKFPMGIASALGAFQSLMEISFAGLSHEIVLVYLDDVIVFGRNFDESLKRLDPSNVSSLGHIKTESGVVVDQ